MGSPSQALALLKSPAESLKTTSARSSWLTITSYAHARSTLPYNCITSDHMSQTAQSKFKPFPLSTKSPIFLPNLSLGMPFFTCEASFVDGKGLRGSVRIHAQSSSLHRPLRLLRHSVTNRPNVLGYSPSPIELLSVTPKNPMVLILHTNKSQSSIGFAIIYKTQKTKSTCR